DELYTRAFFNKMAEYGLVPETEEAALAMLSTAYKIDALSHDPTVKQAMAEHDPYVAADRDLDNLLSGGQGGQEKSASYISKTPEAAINQTALALAENSDLYKAALSVLIAQSSGGEQ